MAKMIERDGKPIFKASDGQLYTTVTHAGAKKEGETFPFFLICTQKHAADTEKAAMSMLMEHIDNLKQQNAGKVLEWRARPYIDRGNDYFGDQVYISAKARLAFIDPLSIEEDLS